ncbi:MAG: hypothetical protein IPP66_08365 [Anaerolineales bacterium]|nr:hypothetical protein [Anaerolineales bacterium]
MKDLGFGLVEQRTVIVVLMTATLCHILGLTFPLHTDNILLAFIDLIFLTGYIYLVRSIIRFPFAFGAGVWKAAKQDEEVLERCSESTQRFYLKTKDKYSFAGRIIVFIMTLIDQSIWKGYLGFIDRLSLIAITVLVTIPTIGQSLMTIGGSIGVFTMLLIYLIGGTFSFIVEDALKKSADEHTREQKELQYAARHPNINIPSFPSTIYTKPEPPDYSGGGY